MLGLGSSAIANHDGITGPYNTTTNTYALHLDGSGDYVDVADDDTLSFDTGTTSDGIDLPFSLALWIKKDVDGNSNDSIVAKGNTSSGTLEYRIFQGGGRIYVDLSDGTTSGLGNYRRVYWNGVDTNDDWKHVVITYDGDTDGGGDGMFLYINGTATTGTDGVHVGGSDTDGMDNFSGTLRIGQMQSASTWTHAGEMCQIIMWKNHVLTPSEVTYLYAGGAAHRDPTKGAQDYSGASKVVLWLPFQDDLNDASGNSNNGTAVGHAALSNSTVPF
jgi:hypothetical protein